MQKAVNLFQTVNENHTINLFYMGKRKKKYFLQKQKGKGDLDVVPLSANVPCNSEELA